MPTTQPNASNNDLRSEHPKAVADSFVEHEVEQPVRLLLAHKGKHE